MPTVIVALPSAEDKVHKISSEKVPHLTICSLGDNPDSVLLAEVVKYVQHAATLLGPFGLSVDHRGILGDKQADVLFFENGPRDAERIKGFRHNLLMSDIVKKMYDVGDQFPDWIPHLTLGFPDTPANKDDSDYPGINYVSFDRIAVWTGDYDGPEFRLKYDDRDMEVAMGEKTEAFLAHYGKKGMKWGVRKDLVGLVSLQPNAPHVLVGNRIGTKAPNAADRKGVMEATNHVRNAILDMKTGALGPKGELTKLNTNLRKTGFIPNSSPEAMAKYNRDVSSALTKTAKKNAPKGSDALVLVTTTHMHLLVGKSKEIKDAAKDLSHSELFEKISMELTRDESGLIIKITTKEESMQQNDVTDDFLAHYGIKGMRWGVRREDPSAGGGVSGGKGTKGNDDDDDDQLSADAIRFIKTHQKAGTHQMSDREIKEAVNRAKMVKEYNDLFSPDPAAALKAKVNLLETQKKYGQIKAELNPSARAKAIALVSSASAAYLAYKKLDRESDGALSRQINSVFGRGAAVPPLKVSTPGSTAKNNPFKMAQNPGFNPKKKKTDPVFKVTSL